MPRHTAKFVVRLGRELGVTRPLEGWETPLEFSTRQGRFDVSLAMLPEQEGRHISPARGITTFRVERLDVRVTGRERSGLPTQLPTGIVQLRRLTERELEYATAAQVIVNKLLHFFRYTLRNPLLEDVEPWDLLGAEWSDDTGRIAQFMNPTVSREYYIAEIHRSLQPERDQELGAALRRRHTPPPSLVDELLLSALEALAQSNVRRAVLETAICCEVAVKTALYSAPHPAGEVLRYLDERAREGVSVSLLLDRIGELVLGESFKSANAMAHRGIDLLFRTRNSVAHRGLASYKDDGGRSHEVTLHKVREWLAHVEELIAWLPAAPRPRRTTAGAR